MINYFIALVLTLVIEVTVGLLFGYRSKSAVLAIIGVNLVTHPILNLLIRLNARNQYMLSQVPLILFLELVVVFVEWGLLCLALGGKRGWLFLLSATMNSASFFIGVVLYGL